MKAATTRVTLSDGPLSLFDADGSSIILHGNPDQGITGEPKSGVSGGPRVACGVIEKKWSVSGKRLEAGCPIRSSTHGIRKQYGGLRPLRVQSLAIGSGERVALSGSMRARRSLVNLVTGASVPDEGTVEVCGRATHAISDGDDWLAWLDRFGVVSPRAVLLDAASLKQNLAMPLTLQIEPIPPEIAAQTEQLAADVGLAGELLDRPIAGLDAALRARAHLARAIVWARRS